MWTLFRIIYYISLRGGISWILAPIYLHLLALPCNMRALACTGGLHLLEGTLATAATLKGGYELATAIGTGIRGMAAAAGPAAAVALL